MKMLQMDVNPGDWLNERRRSANFWRCDINCSLTSHAVFLLFCYNTVCTAGVFNLRVGDQYRAAEEELISFKNVCLVLYQIKYMMHSNVLCYDLPTLG